MSLQVGSINATTAAAATETAAPEATGGGALPFGVGTTATGAHIAQGGGAATGGSSLITKMLAGGVVGAGLGFAASFFTLPVIGQVGAPIAAAVGAGIGAVGGAVWHFISQRRQNLAMQAQQQGSQPSAMQPTPMPTAGTTLRANARGPAARKLQTDLKALGLYGGKMTGSYDSATQQAVRKYEVMKGVVPTGQGTAEVRAAVAQDASLVRQHV